MVLQHTMPILFRPGVPKIFQRFGTNQYGPHPALTSMAWTLQCSPSLRARLVQNPIAILLPWKPPWLQHGTIYLNKSCMTLVPSCKIVSEVLSKPKVVMLKMFKVHHLYDITDSLCELIKFVFLWLPEFMSHPVYWNNFDKKNISHCWRDLWVGCSQNHGIFRRWRNGHRQKFVAEYFFS